MVESIKWLIFTNLYIAFAAFCFQLIIVVLSDSIKDWNWILSIHTFFSTWFIYQFSRYQFHTKVEVKLVKQDVIYNWLNNHQKFTKISIVISFLITFATLFGIHLATIKVLILLGVISILYPLKLPGNYAFKGLRTIPFLKVFLIAFVWAGISVWVPIVELGLQLKNYYWFFLFQAVYVLFITIPFDVADMETDRATKVKTIPALMGVNSTKFLIVLLLIILIGLVLLGYFQWNWKNNWLFVFLFISMLIVIAGNSLRINSDSEKWKVMAIYDGSMIMYLIIILIFYAF